MMSTTCTIRPAKPEDIPSINKIHRHYVENTVLTFTTEPNTDATALSTYQELTSCSGQGLPYLVATSPTNAQEILAYTYVSPFRGTKAGYRHTLELSLFCAPEHVRQGVGAELLERLIAILRRPDEWEGWFEGRRLVDWRPRQLIACMAVDVEMPGEGWRLRDWYLRRGFEQRGHLREVGWKMERWVDTVYLQLALDG